MANNRKNPISFFIFTALAAGAFFLPPAGPSQVQAAMSETEIRRQLNNVVSVFSNLSQAAQTEQNRALISAELRKLLAILNNLINESNATLAANQGQVLGATFPPPEAILTLDFTNFSLPARVTHFLPQPVMIFRVNSRSAPAEIQRIQVVFNDQIWRWAEEISLVGDNRILISAPLGPDNILEVDRRDYIYTFANLSVKVPKNGSQTFWVRLKARENHSAAGRTFRIYLNNNGIRAADLNNNFQHLLPLSGGGPSGVYTAPFEIAD